MSAHTFNGLVDACRKTVSEIMPWDLTELLEKNPDLLIIDVREPSEFEAMHIKDTVHIPRGLLEAACEFGYEETHPALANARDQHVIVVCRSGNRSLLAAQSMQLLGYKNVVSLQTGLRGWNDYELEMVDSKKEIVDMDYADEFFTAVLREDQKLK